VSTRTDGACIVWVSSKTTKKHTGRGKLDEDRLREDRMRSKPGPSRAV